MKARYIVAITALIAALGIGLAALIVRTSAQTHLNHAAVIVQMKDGGIATRCVAFSESEITGYDLLRRAQMPVIVDVSNGISVCKIGPTSGCNYPAQKCFCDCQDLNGTCIYWMYYYQDKGQWKYAALGAGSQKVKDGDVNGWVYGAGTTTGGAFPPVISYEQICDAAPPPVTPDAHPVITPTLASAPASTVASVVVTPTSIARVTATVVISTPEASATVSSTATPQASLSATATLTPIASHTPIASLTPMSIATLAPPTATPALPTPTPAPVATTEQSSPNVIGYVVFGVIAIGLTAALLITRRNSGKANR